jgi:hypothetical protein
MFLVRNLALLIATRILLPMATIAGEGVATNADFAAHVAKMQRQAPAGFTVVAEPPFVVLGDESAEMVRLRASNTVQLAVSELKRDYFSRDPLETIDIWLFKDKSSYTNHAWELFGEKPNTPFGYYSAAHHALIMDISTGGGTLVHEIVHPFMAANFPGCPPWFNEGLASLYEASAMRDGHMRGLVNWRWKGLAQAIKDGKTIPFEKMMAMTDTEFYGGANSPNYSDHYAQARYLCYYLQEKGLLVKYYREFTSDATTDPTGFQTLKRVLGETDMKAFQKKWEKFILRLAAP